MNISRGFKVAFFLVILTGLIAVIGSMVPHRQAVYVNERDGKFPRVYWIKVESELVVLQPAEVQLLSSYDLIHSDLPKGFSLRTDDQNRPIAFEPVTYSPLNKG